MESFANPFIQIMFILTMVVISLAGISIRIQKGNKLQKESLEQSRIKTDTDYSSIGVFFQGGRTLVKCPSCAELISIEAKICKECKTNVEKYVKEIETKIIRLKSERTQKSAEQKIEIQKVFKKIGIFLVVAVLVIGSTSILTPIIKDNFFPTKLQRLASEWESAFAKCGFTNVKVIVNYKSDHKFTNNPRAIEAEGKFKESPIKKQCLTEEFNLMYEKFNVKPIYNSSAGIGGWLRAYWFVGNGRSGTWDNDYAGSSEVYFATHNWGPWNT